MTASRIALAVCRPSGKFSRSATKSHNSGSLPVLRFTPTIRQACELLTPWAISRANHSRFSVCGVEPGRPRTIAIPEATERREDHWAPPDHERGQPT
jgi:hypothetical protein